MKIAGLTKEEKNWILYDVANSAYVLTSFTVLFPLLQKIVAAQEGISSIQAARVMMIVTGGVTLLVALFSPFVGAMANYGNKKGGLFKGFFALGVSAGLIMALPGLPYVPLFVFFALSSIGYSGANILYDAFLVDVTTKERMDQVSTAGFGYGYIGGLIPFFVGALPYGLALFGVLDKSRAWNIRGWTFTMEELTISIGFLVSLLWWLVLALPMLVSLKQGYSLRLSGGKIFRDVLGDLRSNFQEIRKYRQIFLFLLAYFFYIDVVNSVIRLATTIGGALEGVEDFLLLLVVVIVQLIAFPCSLAFGRLCKVWGAKKVLLWGLSNYVWVILCTYGISEERIWLIFLVAILIGVSQGGVQGVSRSFFAKMLPQEKANKFFGLFGVFGRFAGVASPFLLAFLSQSYSMNIAILGLLLPLGIGMLLLVLVQNP